MNSIEYMISWLKSNMDVEAVVLSTFSPYFLEHLRFNAAHCDFNKNAGAEGGNDFVAFRLLPTERNRAIDPAASEALPLDDFHYVVFDRLTGYFETDCNRLYSLLELKRGLSFEDYEKDDSIKGSYLYNIRALAND